MKKILTLALIVALCIFLFACNAESVAETVAPPHPFTKNYETVDEVVAVITANYNGTAKHDEMIEQNESIAKYFREDYADTEIWRLLDEAEGSELYMSQIHYLYKICNQTPTKSNWYDLINIGDGTPFAHYRSDTPTPSSLEKAVKNKFKDPDSVEVRNAKIAYVMPEGTTDPNGFKYFDEDIHYYIFAEIYANNSFGGRTMDIYCITGRVGYLPSKITEFYGNSVQDIGVSVAFENNGCGHPWLIFD